MLENNIVDRLFYNDPNTKINEMNLKHSRSKSNGRWCLEDFDSRKANYKSGMDFEQKTLSKYMHKLQNFEKARTNVKVNVN